MKSLVLLSGGVDSTTALALAVRDYEEVIALSVSYGQKHARELRAAENVAKFYKIPLKTIDLNAVFADSDCVLLSNSEAEIPKESYGEQTAKTGGLTPVSTYVPFRNGLFISTAAAVAISNGCEAVIYGAHADDSAGSAYPDCSPEFAAAMNSALITGSGGGLKLSAPFVNMTKAEIVKLGVSLNVPYELTWSCYVGSDRPCGQCGTCIDRAAAFAAAGIKDPAI
ncbi:MAG: 7-cyano-7-deazaguanine synthase QueC [Ruminococcus sp.]|jgi:7-cyano-7-deazaguanine synthase|nr:7-cyano-7-deazaguanine synthase QueC [Ruminococcus sp.]